MGGFLLAHASVADEVKVEYLPYPKKDLKRLVKTEFFLIEQEAMKNSLTGKLKQQFASWTTAVANNKEPIAETAADIFYDRLFEIAPSVRSMFPAEMSDQKGKLMQTLAVAVTNLHQVETIVPTVQELGKRHVGYGVKDEHYDVVGDALIYTLGKGLGDEFTPDVEEAWVETFRLVAGVMKDAAATVEPPKKGFFSTIFSLSNTNKNRLLELHHSNQQNFVT
jgi:hemoglobin-like flavoprotein